MYTASTSSGRKCARFNASAIAMLPNFVAGTALKTPLKPPIGVRTALTMTVCCRWLIESEVLLCFRDVPQVLARMLPALIQPSMPTPARIGLPVQLTACASSVKRMRSFPASVRGVLEDGEEAELKYPIVTISRETVMIPKMQQVRKRRTSTRSQSRSHSLLIASYRDLPRTTRLRL